jgi:putative DNA primase/helicase
MTFHQRTTEASKGKWRGILLTLGLPEEALRGKHTACPLCGGTDRFRWDNRDGRGTYICNACGAGDGMKLACEFTGKPFAEVAAQIDAILGNVKPDAPQRPAMSDDDRLRILREAWAASKPVQPGDLAHKYLEARGIEELVYPKALRFAPAMRDGDGGVRPCLVAMVGVYGAPKYATMHRTFLRPDGLAKAEMPSPRKLMPGEIPDGACVALSDYTGGPLGIAEGIETAMSASALYGLPVWAAISAVLMEKWWPPEGCDEVAIFGDHDANHAGHRAAYALSNRLRLKGITTTVHIPPNEREDWNNVWLRQRRKA